MIFCIFLLWIFNVRFFLNLVWQKGYREKERQTLKYRLLSKHWFHSNMHNSWAWANLKEGTKNSLWISQKDVREWLHMSLSAATQRNRSCCSSGVFYCPLICEYSWISFLLGIKGAQIKPNASGPLRLVHQQKVGFTSGTGTRTKYFDIGCRYSKWWFKCCTKPSTFYFESYWEKLNIWAANHFMILNLSY